MNLEQLIVPSDLKHISGPDRKNVAKQSGIPVAKKRQSQINNELIENVLERKPKTFVALSKFTDKIFAGGSTSWYHMNIKYVKELKNLILNKNPQVSKSFLGIKENIGNEPILLGIADFSVYVPHSYILKYECRTGQHNILLQHHVHTIINRSYVNVVVIPKKELIEIRANRHISRMIFNHINKYYNNKLTKSDFYHIKFNNQIQFNQRMDKLTKHTGAKLNETVDVLSVLKALLKNTSITKIKAVIKSINNRMSEYPHPQKDADVNGFIDNLEKNASISSGISFSLLLMSGLNKIDLQTPNQINLKKVPLISTIDKSNLQILTNSISLPMNGVFYPINIGKYTSTINFHVKSNEQLISIIRNDFIL